MHRYSFTSNKTNMADENTGVEGTEEKKDEGEEEEKKED